MVSRLHSVYYRPYGKHLLSCRSAWAMSLLGLYWIETICIGLWLYLALDCAMHFSFVLVDASNRRRQLHSLVTRLTTSTFHRPLLTCMELEVGNDQVDMYWLQPLIGVWMLDHNVVGLIMNLVFGTWTFGTSLMGRPWCTTEWWLYGCLTTMWWVW
jgi:hypothetical protein